MSNVKSNISAYGVIFIKTYKTYIMIDASSNMMCIKVVVHCESLKG